MSNKTDATYHRGDEHPIRVTEIHNERGELTHQMCCLCFDFIAVQDLWVCEHGQKWDSCKPCAPHLGGCYCTEEKEEDESAH